MPYPIVASLSSKYTSTVIVRGQRPIFAAKVEEGKGIAAAREAMPYVRKGYDTIMGLYDKNSLKKVHTTISIRRNFRYKNIVDLIPFETALIVGLFTG
jgi:hypothetical protein